MRRMLDTPPRRPSTDVTARAPPPGRRSRSSKNGRPHLNKTFVRDLELHAAQLQALMQQVMQEREFVKQENAQLRLAVKGLFKAGSTSNAANKAPPILVTVNISATEKKVRRALSCARGLRRVPSAGPSHAHT